MGVSSRILVIEDDATNLEVVSYLLGAFGYLVVAARDADEALEIARRERPDLILCDIQLPGEGGMDLAARLRADAALRRTPIVAVTALAMVGDRERILNAGFDGYISKPIFPESFIETIRRYLPGDGQDTRR
jgi:CheY-like chemotaxis protein